MMKNKASVIVLLAALSFHAHSVRCEAPDACASLSHLQAALGDRFRVHNTQHFSILYDSPYETLRPLTARLEGIYDAIDRFCATLDFPIKPFSTRFTILVFSRYEDFLAFAQKAGLGEGVAGFYNPKDNVAAFVDVMDSPSLRPLHGELTRLDSMLAERNGPFAVRRQRDEVVNRVMTLRAQRDALVESFNRLVLQHEAAHQVLFNRSVHMRGAKTPLWLAKGLACQFEIPQPDAHGALKRVNQMRLGDFREALGAQRNGDGARTLWQQAVEAGKMMALPDLIGADQFEGDGLTLAARYAQSWALVHYLHREHSRGFEKYLARLAARQTGHEISIQEELADFAAAFGPADTGVANAWVTYILRLRYDGTDR